MALTTKGFGFLYIKESSKELTPFEKLKDVFNFRKPRSNVFSKSSKDYRIEKLSMDSDSITCILTHNQVNGNDPEHSGVSIARLVDSLRETVGHVHNLSDAANMKTKGNGVEISAETKSIPNASKFQHNQKTIINISKI